MKSRTRISPVITMMAISAMACIGFFSTNCERIEPERLIIIKASAVSDVTRTSCTVTATLFDVGPSGVSQHGFCLSLTPDPADAVNCSQMGSKSTKGEFGGDLTGLAPGTSYHAWAYASKGDAKVYGKPLAFTTLSVGLPEVETEGVSNITSNSADCGGNIISDGGAEITNRGVCWNTSVNPTIEHAHTTDGAGSGTYGSGIADLISDTDYYVRAYATNSTGTAYGNELTFTTLPAPVEPSVVTSIVEGITTTSATCGGSISSEGGSPVTSKGFCWSTDPDPDLSDFNSLVGSGPEPFSLEISDLAPDTYYYVKAYATNSAGTGYGNQQEFRTLFNCGTQLVDKRDGQTYLTVSIGDQCWMAENLNIGDQIVFPATPGDNGAIEKYCYDDDNANCDLYGGQYTWDEMMQYTQVEMVQGICPDGWHIPSDHEWKILERTLGMTVEESDGTHWRGSDEGGKLKAAGTTYWDTPNEGATNSSLFTALPSGFLIHNGTFAGLGFFTVFWTSTPILETQAWYRQLDADHSQIYRVDGYRPNTTPVRCVKD